MSKNKIRERERETDYFILLDYGFEECTISCIIWMVDIQGNLEVIVVNKKL
jgi:hypothetical protein